MSGHLLHPELMVDVSGVARAHILRVEDVDLDEADGCQLLKTRSSPIIALLLGFIKVHPSLVCVILAVILLI